MQKCQGIFLISRNKQLSQTRFELNRKEIELISKEKFVSLFLDFIKRMLPEEKRNELDFTENGFFRIKEVLAEIEDSICELQSENEELKAGKESCDEEGEQFIRSLSDISEKRDKLLESERDESRFEEIQELESDPRMENNKVWTSIEPKIMEKKDAVRNEEFGYIKRTNLSIEEKSKPEVSVIERMKEKMKSLEEKLNSFTGSKYSSPKKVIDYRGNTNIYMNNVHLKPTFSKSFLS